MSSPAPNPPHIFLCAHTVCAWVHTELKRPVGAAPSRCTQSQYLYLKADWRNFFLGGGALKEIFCSQGYGTHVFMPLRVR